MIINGREVKEKLLKGIDVMIIGNYLENLHLTEQHKIEKKFRSDNQ